MDESFPLPGRGAELNWKLLFIPPVSRRRIRFVCNWFKPDGCVCGGVFCGGKAKVFLLMGKMIEFVLSRVPLCLLSFYPLPVSVNQIISLPCQHTLLVEQSKLICKRALWFFFSPLPFCLFLPPLLSLMFSFCQMHFSSSIPLPFFAERALSSFNEIFTVALRAYRPMMRWQILSQAGDVSHRLKSPATPCCDKVRPLVKGSLSTGFHLYNGQPESEEFLWGKGYKVIIHHPRLCPSPSGTLPRQQSISVAIHHRHEFSWEGGARRRPLHWRGPNEGLSVPLIRKTLAILSWVNYHVALSPPSTCGALYLSKKC